jgi:hypothetical protein
MKSRRYNSLRLLALLLGSVLVSPLWGLDSAKVAQTKYDALNAKITGGELDIDWRDLRLDAIVAGVDGDFDWHQANSDGVVAFNAGDYNKALLKAQEITKHNIANGDGHLLAMVSLKHLGKQDEAAHEKAIVDKIVQSIMSSGDGKTADTAFFTVSPSEEYFALRTLGLKPSTQALVKQGQHSFDKMTALDKDGKETILWFNTDTDIELTRKAEQGID